MNLTREQQEEHEKYGFEFTERGWFSQVRTNMMEDVNYVPYCLNCPGLQRVSKTSIIGILKCNICGYVITYPKDFIDRFKAKHNL